MAIYGNVWWEYMDGGRFQSCINEKSVSKQMETLSSTPLGIRTLDPLIKSQLLYQLS